MKRASAERPVPETRWSRAQREVWGREEEYWVYRSKARIREYKALFHEDFVGWPGRCEFPASKKQLRGAATREYRTARIVKYDLQPGAVCIHEGFGVAYYYATLHQRGENGRLKASLHRFTHIWKKRNQGWYLIGGNSYRVRPK